MIDFLVELLYPLFSSGPVAVSKTDLTTYVSMTIGYVVVIFIALIAMILGMVFASKAKKGFRHVIRWHSALAFVLVVIVCVNLICYGPMYNNLSLILNADRTELSEETVASSKDVIRQVGEEGIVLVKNSGLLPLNTDVNALNVFGWASSNPIFGGSGSGSTVDPTKVSIIQSFNEAGYATNTALTEMYTTYRAERPYLGMNYMDCTVPEPTMDYYTDSVMNDAKSFSDVAVIVIGRPGGEGADLPTDMAAVIDGSFNVASVVSVVPEKYGYSNTFFTNNGDYNDFDKGDHFLMLSNTEEMLVEKVCSEFDDVVVIINANNPMELDWVNDYEQIGAVLLAPGGGSTAFSALGEIVSGKINPSARTVDIYPRDLTKTPYFNNIGNHAFTNVADLAQAIADVDPGFEGAMSFVNYVEGVYVGYRYYETAAEEGVLDYDDAVVFPFGYGLSYTTFDKKISNFADNGDNVSLEVTVTNTGSVAGKDVVELYYTPPYNNGGVEKSSVNLVEFGKTGVLQPGASETLNFEIPKEDMATYDSDGVKIQGGGYILEAGTYTISLRSDSHTILDTVSFSVEADVDYSVDGRPSDVNTAVNHFDYARGTFEQLSRKDKFANFNSATARPAADDYIMDDATRAAVTENAVGFYDGTRYNNSADIMPTLEARNGLKVASLRGAEYGDQRWDTLLDQMSFEDMVTLINTGGWQTAAVDSVGLVGTSNCDGPAALNNYIAMKFGTAFTSQIMLGQTWSKEMAAKVGAALGAEFAETDTSGIYGPGLNMHRSAFAGRNFEYYSEDPVLSGMMASAEVNALTDKGVFCYTKHFGLNDQETNRCAFLLTYSSEQAMREIYLKPFEIITKKFSGQGQAMMTSFNWIGTRPVCASGALLNDVTRGEWGFEGMILTDYDGSYGSMITDNCIRNGGDIKLGFYTSGRSLGRLNVNQTEMTDRSATAILAMRQASKNIMYTVVNSRAYADGANIGGMSKMDSLFLTVNIIFGVIILGTSAFIIWNWKRKQKKTPEQVND